MPAALLEVPNTDASGRHAYQLKTSAKVRGRVMKIVERYGCSYNDALNLLIVEALDARGVTTDPE